MVVPDMQVRCDSCGKYTGMDTGCCGQCAEDFNDRDRAAGMRRVQSRRIANGLRPLDEVSLRGHETAFKATRKEAGDGGGDDAA